MAQNPPNWDNYTDYDKQQFLKNHVLVCVWCGEEFKEDADEDDQTCCAEFTGKGEWLETCGCCEAPIYADENSYERRRYGASPFTICETCQGDE